MSEEDDSSSGNYTVRKRFRNEEHARRPKDMPWSKQILDLEHNQFFSRTPFAWFRILMLYIVLYLAIILITVVWIVIFQFGIYPEGKPLWPKKTPGISTVPSSSETIKFQPNIQTETYNIADKIDNFIDGLDDFGIAEDLFSECNEDTLWGYNAKTPCIFIKLNKIIGFKADTYDSIDDLPKDHPVELEKIIESNPGEGRIWVTCDCKTEDDPPDITYIPKPYFDSNSDMEGINRVLAVKIVDMPFNKELEFVCKVWAKNIEIDEELPGCGNAQFKMKMVVPP
ncbi:hypothetical protein KR222_008540 [Zaprionus bogoriensis]|nr:hypothetical protein KR222_008540 [Zaprionus bogoriensis]